MNAAHHMMDLLRGDPSALVPWLREEGRGRIALCSVFILVSFALYGLTLGMWRDPMMGVYVGIKMPTLIFFILLCNGFLNAVVSLLSGSGLGFRGSFLALLMSFSIAGAILGSVAPVTFFMALNAPDPNSANAGQAHAFYLLTHTALIAFAGVVANLHLWRLLTALCPNRRSAQITLFSWLAGNAFVGAQFSWILRPFIGSPNLKVAFLRADPFDGNFYEAVWNSFARIFGDFEPLIPIFFLIAVAIGSRLFNYFQAANKKLNQAQKK